MYSDDDPRSINYKRIHKKQPINLIKLFSIVLIYLCLFVILYTYKSILLYFSIIYIILNLKNIIILIVKLYQKFAPLSIRNKCRFEPSCSNYMIYCLKKYGLIKGLLKGINRLKRCNINGGGYDYP